MAKLTIVAVRHKASGKKAFYQFPSKKSARDFTKDLDVINNEEGETWQYLIQI